MPMMTVKGFDDDGGASDDADDDGDGKHAGGPRD
jgi:hypothetical protein